MNTAYETIEPEFSPQACLSSENLSGDAYLKIDFAEFGYVEYKRDDPVDGLHVLGVFEEGLEDLEDLSPADVLKVCNNRRIIPH
jgi:hypothetical protein